MIKIENTEVYGWEAAKGFEDYYLISKDGKIYSKRSKKIIKPFQSRSYMQIELNVNGKAIKKSIHRLVAETYIPNPNNLPCINHKDGNKLNNSVDNLEWCSYSENMKHASNNNLLKTKGENNPQSKLSKTDIQYIRNVYEKGSKEFGTVALGKQFKVDHKTIWAIVNNVTWRTIS